MAKTDTEKRMLLIVDPQVDFINGTLPVPGAEKAMNALATYVQEHGEDYRILLVTCDRHGMRHSSFKEFGGEWQRHCVESSVGAAIWQPLMDALYHYSARVVILYKGEDLHTDDYSILHSPEGRRNMDELLRNNSVEEIDICGLAGDVCVAHTLMDIRKEYPGIRINVLDDFTASLDGGETIAKLKSTLP